MYADVKHVNTNIASTYDCIITGTSSPTGRFFASFAVLASHEDTDTWSTIYQFVKDLGVNPEFQMGDGAKAITKAGKKVFSDMSFHRLMCWSHVHAKILPQLKSVAAHKKEVSESILKDIVDLQWSVLNEKTFRKAFKLIENKYVDKYDVVLNGVLSKFFAYICEMCGLTALIKLWRR